MPMIHFICPDGEYIEINQCLSKHGCRMGQRCATKAYLRLAAQERPYNGVTPSMAGNGPRLIYLKELVDYAVSPESRAFAALGVGVHGKLSVHAFTDNILSEEPLSDEQTAGTPDCLEEDEENEGCYILTDYKTFGSFKVAKALGIYKEDVPVTDDEGNQIYYKSGQKKGQGKTRQEIRHDPSKADVMVEAYQLNRYRILFEQAGFPISRMQLQAIVRDGNTKSASMNGVNHNVYIIELPRYTDQEVLGYYHQLECEIDCAFYTDQVRLCNDWESWGGRRCERFCEVKEACKAMEQKANKLKAA